MDCKKFCPKCLTDLWSDKSANKPLDSNNDDDEEIIDDNLITKPLIIAKKIKAPDTEYGLGKLHYILTYNIKKEVLRIKLVKATCLIAIDECGTSDPFVRIQFQPHCYEQTFWETHVIKKTLNPKWKALFVFRQFPNETLKTTQLEFSVLDWNLDGKQTNIGELVVPLKKLYASLENDPEPVRSVVAAPIYNVSNQCVLSYGSYNNEVSKETSESETSVTSSTKKSKSSQTLNEKASARVSNSNEANENDYKNNVSDDSYKNLAKLRHIKKETIIRRWMQVTIPERRVSEDQSLKNLVKEVEMLKLQIPTNVGTQTNVTLPNGSRWFEEERELQLPRNIEKNGEIQIGLSYDPHYQRLVVHMLNARNFVAASGKSLSAYVIITRKKKLKMVEKKYEELKTSLRKDTSTPVWNEQFEFKITPEDLSFTVIDVTVMRYNQIKSHTSLGKIRLGLKSRPQQKIHWENMIKNIGVMIPEWHKLMSLSSLT